MEFRKFGKVPRLFRECVITEKIDGTNACVIVGEDGTVGAQSRSRIITPGDDNYGFARWVQENFEELRGLGPGHHFGEWWGRGVQRGYGLSEKRFSLFNVHLWDNPDVRPKCCDVVPVLWRGVILQDGVAAALMQLRTCGSVAAYGYTKPEGIVVYHTAGGGYFKVTLENDEERKGAVKSAPQDVAALAPASQTPAGKGE